MSSPSLATSDREPVRLALLGEFRLEVGDSTVVVPGKVQRLVAYLALQGRSVPRGEAVDAVCEKSDRSQATLRTALWRLEGVRDTVLTASRTHLGLTPAVSVDVHEAVEMAFRVLDHDGRDLPPLTRAAALLSADMLPGWSDTWLAAHAERWRQLRLHALEALAAVFADRGAYGEAVLAALNAVWADPLRESARIALMRVHVAEGNRAEALREYREYETLLNEKLGIAPSTDLATVLVRAPGCSRAAGGRSRARCR